MNLFLVSVLYFYTVIFCFLPTLFLKKFYKTLSLAILFDLEYYKTYQVLIHFHVNKVFFL